MINHREQRQGDELFCARCGKRWAVDETPPPCAPIGQGNPVVTDEHGVALWKRKPI